ncbi:hypothetical protein CLM62_16475 [Streptomyces sp. SA15]|uniref:hypothetical protein n=1 Tax=Streptomyces sp. SA15 TaxID=934019 RepID=UPI000BAFF394|nr:hypothetical protein [Streptomyces sp. SA15]PAZ14962.1 hypothetical protein CLM62_16475 [Streptomyces sp. SA15]
MVDDLPSTLRAEMMADDPVEQAMTRRRYERLLDALGEIHAERADEPIRVAIVYGAPPVLRHTPERLDSMQSVVGRGRCDADRAGHTSTYEGVPM